MSKFDEKYGKLSKKEYDLLPKEESTLYWNLYREAEEEESNNVDLSKYMALAAEEVHEILCDLFDSAEWATLPNGMVSPKGNAYHTALLELRNEKRSLEGVQAWLKNTKYAYLSDKITDIIEGPTEMAECGCCVDSGGDVTVLTSLGITVLFDHHGSLKENQGDGRVGFKRLKFS